MAGHMRTRERSRLTETEAITNLMMEPEKYIEKYNSLLAKFYNKHHGKQTWNYLIPERR